MDRTDLIECIAERSGKDVAIVTNLVDALIRVLAEDLAASGKVVLPGIGVIRRDTARKGEFLLYPEEEPDSFPDVADQGRAARKGERIRNALKALDFITRNI